MDRLTKLSEEKTFPYLVRGDRRDLSIIRFGQAPGRETERLLAENSAEPKSSSLMEQQKDLLMILAPALLLLYLCLGYQFESLIVPLLLMLVIPAGAAGITTALLLCRSSINLYSCLGLLVITGLSVNNGILLFEESGSVLKEPGSTPAGAVYRGTASRLMPIMLTGLTTAGALLPLAAASGRNPAQASLASAILGGLSVSTAVSLLILPGIMLRHLQKERAAVRAI